MKNVMKKTFLVAALSLLASPAVASDDDIMKVRAAGDVDATMDALEEAVTGAGASIIARVNHSGGAESVDMALNPAQLLIFGNPRVGTPAMQANQLAGLFLPLKILVYTDAQGQTWLAYEDPAETLDDLDGVDDDAEYIRTMQGALGNLTAAAAGN